MSRPTSPILSPRIIADAALELVEQTGDLQMVQLAKHLGVAPSSLYSHVQGRAGVIDLARRRMLESIEPQEAGAHWRAAVETLLRQLVRHYSSHTKLLPLIFGTPVANEQTIAIYEPVFNALTAAGLPPEHLRLSIALIESQALGLSIGLPAPVMSPRIRETLPGYTTSIDHSIYNRDTATDFAVTIVLAGLDSLLTAP